ncbi:MAG: D-alanyl-D-alanine carboxypeptidase/D-alanyl-D-alanine-endopeptidase [Planctomycetes bacterium]|nr:D-alanyl-D-alanine carboxypeptidase/D-alanyl-D-alanine-endopeptidase [Planctomycetota bacterium]
MKSAWLWTILGSALLAAPARADLAAELRARLEQSAKTRWTALVLDGGEPVFALDADEARVPASNMKLVTTAAALSLLGPDYAHETRLVTVGRPQAGVLRGALYVVGGGDPTISRRFDPEPLLSDWAEKVARSGIKRIVGDLVADDRFFEALTVHPDWERPDLEKWYGAPICGLSLNDNCADVSVGGSAGGVVVVVRPSSDYLQVEQQARLIGDKKQHRFGVVRAGKERRTLQITGKVWSGARPYEASIPVEDPALFFLHVLKARLAEAGVEVTGECRRLQPGEEPGGLTLYRRQAPLPRTLQVTNQRSQNFYAECLLKTIGREKGERGTWLAGAKRVKDFAASAGADPAQVTVADGSGLSRENRLSARALTAVLSHMQRGAHAEIYRGSLASPGEEGTLKRRLRGLPPTAEVRGKTGTLTGVSALSGYLKVGDRELVFALIGNGGSTGTIRNAMDAVVERLAKHYAR